MSLSFCISRSANFGAVLSVSFILSALLSLLIPVATLASPAWDSGLLEVCNVSTSTSGKESRFLPQNMFNQNPDLYWVPASDEQSGWALFSFSHAEVLDGIRFTAPPSSPFPPGVTVRLEFSDGTGCDVALSTQVSRFGPVQTDKLKMTIQTPPNAQAPKIAGITPLRGKEEFRLLSVNPYPPAYNLISLPGVEVCLDLRHNLLWQDQALPPSGKKTARADAENLCASLDLTGESGWRLPSLDELHSLYPAQSVLVHGGHSSMGAAPYFIEELLLDESGSTPIPHALDMNSGKLVPVRGQAFYRCVRPVDNALEYLTQRRPPALPEETFIWSDAAALGPNLQAMHALSLEAAVTVFTMNKSAHAGDPARAPQPPLPEAEKNLIKDEFETSAEFAQRKALEAERVATANAEAKRTYEENLAAWRQINQAAPNIETIAMAVHAKYGSPKLKLHYDQDTEEFLATVESSFGSFSHNLRFFLPSAYADKFKNYLLTEHFIPTIEARVKDGKLEVITVRELEQPVYFVESIDFTKALRQGANLGPEQELALREFLVTWPKSSFAPEARHRLALREEEKIRQAQLAALREEARQKAQAEYQAREKARREAEQRAFNAPKNIGDRVFITAQGFLSTSNIIGFVENKNGDRIRIRIVESGANPPRYNGVTLYRDTIIWDEYYNWKLDY